MGFDGLEIQTIWMDVAAFCSLNELGKLQSTCKYLNAILSSNSVWKIQWNKLCELFGVKEKYRNHAESLPLVPFLYQNLCYRLQACLRRRECSQQWFVMNPKDEIESFNIAQNLTSFPSLTRPSCGEGPSPRGQSVCGRHCLQWFLCVN
nr:uncharacterized protein LOC129258257 [Lytechinus pictus]